MSDLIQGEHPQILGEIGVGYGKVAVFCRKPVISLKWGKVAPRLLLIINRKLHIYF